MFDDESIDSNLEPLAEIHWSKKPGYKYQVKPLPQMLLHGGYTVNLKCGNRQRNQMYWQSVRFDADYVAAYFADHYAAILSVPKDAFRSQLCIALSPYLRGCKEYGE